MAYTGEQLEEIERDPVRLRAYFWRVAMANKVLAARKREEARRASFEDGPRLLQEAYSSQRFSLVILEHMDALVESCVCRAPAPSAKLD
jgi:hypothetical protein